MKHRAESLPRIPGEPWAGSLHRARGFRMTGLPATLGESFRWRRSAGFAFSVPVGLSSESFQMPGIVVFARRTALRPAGETSCAEAAIIAERHFSISRPVETDAPTRISRPCNLQGHALRMFRAKLRHGLGRRFGNAEKLTRMVARKRRCPIRARDLEMAGTAGPLRANRRASGRRRGMDIRVAAANRRTGFRMTDDNFWDRLDHESSP